MRLTNNKTYCEQKCDYGEQGECFFDSVEESFDCFERKIYDKLKEYEDLGTVEELKELIGREK